MAFRNLGRLLRQGADDLSTDARMALPPVVVEGTGEEADVTPATVYPNDDPRSDLRAIPGGYPEGYGLDLRDPNAAVAPPAVARRPAPASREELPPELAGVVANLGGVADRAQQAMEADVPRPGSMRGVASRAVESAAMGAATPGRKPLVPPNGAAIPPEVAEFAAKKAAPEAKRSFGGAEIERGLSSMTGNIHAGMDIATNMRTPGYGGAMAEDADRQDAAVAARSAEEKAAREFALKKLGLDRQYAQNETRNEMEREKMRLASQPKPRDELADEKTRAEIAKLKAEAEKARRRGSSGAGQKPETETERLRREKLRQEVTGEDPKKVKAAEVSAQRMRSMIAELRLLHGGGVDPRTGEKVPAYGTEFGGEVGTRMSQLMTGIQLEAKNLAELGALSGPDQALMERLSGSDPSSIGANLKSLFGVDNTEAALKGLEEWVGNTEQAARDIYAPQGGTANAAPPSEEDRAAVKWAQAHPDDPRAARILQLNGAH